MLKIMRVNTYWNNVWNKNFVRLLNNINFQEEEKKHYKKQIERIEKKGNIFGLNETLVRNSGRNFDKKEIKNSTGEKLFKASIITIGLPMALMCVMAFPRMSLFFVMISYLVSDNKEENKNNFNGRKRRRY